MKKIKLILSLVFLLGLASSSHAANVNAAAITLRDSSNDLISSYALTSGAAVQSKTIRVKDNIGFITLLVTEDIAGGAGDVDIYAEYSTDGTNWYRPYTSDMAGTITIEGNIVTALQNVTRWIVFTARLAPYMRIVFDPDANSEVTAVIVYQEDR